MKAFISQMMNGKTPEEIKQNTERITNIILAKFPDAEIIDSYVSDFEELETKNKSIYCLGESIIKIAEADIAVFDTDWYKARGCRIEHAVAKEYGIKSFEISVENDYLIWTAN